LDEPSVSFDAEGFYLVTPEGINAASFSFIRLVPL
jgi:hypothetical protein